MKIFSISATNFKNKNISEQQICCKNFSKPCAFEREDEFVKNKSKQPAFKGGPGLFKAFAANEANPKWLDIIARQAPLYERGKRFSSLFLRDRDRILHSEAYIKLRGKTQVFANAMRDLVSTRVNHSQFVESNADDLAKYLGLNVDLARAGALGHDLGHAPFGHDGEVALDKLMRDYNIQSDFWQGRYWHEKNGLRVADDIETITDPSGWQVNLNLTNGVRDIIVSHCGEVDQNGILPRVENVDLRKILRENRPQPYTMEGCVVKVCDKTAYVGVDIEDALRSRFLEAPKQRELAQLVADTTKGEIIVVNNGNLMNYFLTDLMDNSIPHDGIKFSPQASKLMDTVKQFNSDEIYGPAKQRQIAEINEVINSIFEALDRRYDGKNTFASLDKVSGGSFVPIQVFKEWLVKYSDIDLAQKKEKKYANKTLYSIDSQNDYRLAIIEFIAGMTDDFARYMKGELWLIGC